ncbi:MAG: hypothetical protein MMC33_004811 [Icmadophila ericetorum]|nr:hypothetical protein [Icmadophila ericetorum]
MDHERHTIAREKRSIDLMLKISKAMQGIATEMHDDLNRLLKEANSCARQFRDLKKNSLEENISEIHSPLREQHLLYQEAKQLFTNAAPVHLEAQELLRRADKLSIALGERIATLQKESNPAQEPEVESSAPAQEPTVENLAQKAANLRQTAKNRRLEAESSHKHADLYIDRYRALTAVPRNAVTTGELYSRHREAGKSLEAEIALRKQAERMEKESFHANEEADEIYLALEKEREKAKEAQKSVPALPSPLTIRLPTFSKTKDWREPRESRPKDKDAQNGPFTLPTPTPQKQNREREITNLLMTATTLEAESDRNLRRANTLKAKFTVFCFNTLKSLRRNAADHGASESEVLTETAMEMRREAQKTRRDALLLLAEPCRKRVSANDGVQGRDFVDAEEKEEEGEERGRTRTRTRSESDEKWRKRKEREKGRKLL